MEDCIFCKVASGELPVDFVYEDDDVVAFDDISPQAPVHTLVVPRAHVVNMSSDLPTGLTDAVFSAVSKVAAAKGVDRSGYRVIVNNGPDANQTVQHLHVHIMGGRGMAHGMITFADE
jgi:histidine triad (HIT) family protein